MSTEKYRLRTGNDNMQILHNKPLQALRVSLVTDSVYQLRVALAKSPVLVEAAPAVQIPF
jgi:hypothetical protein